MWVSPPSGIVSLEAKSFRLHSYHTVTGLKFFVTAAPSKPATAPGAGGVGGNKTGLYGASSAASPPPAFGGAAGPSSDSGAGGGGGGGGGSKLVTTIPSHKVNLEQFLSNVYRLYTDYGTACLLGCAPKAKRGVSDSVSMIDRVM